MVTFAKSAGATFERKREMRVVQIEIVLKLEWESSMKGQGEDKKRDDSVQYYILGFEFFELFVFRVIALS